jgi:hypothetical protein
MDDAGVLQPGIATYLKTIQFAIEIFSSFVVKSFHEGS